MIDLEYIERLIQALDESGVDSIEIERGGTRVRLAKTPTMTGGAVQVAAPAPLMAPPPTPVAPPAEAGASGETGAAQAGSSSSSGLLEITSPMVGTFYRAPAPDAPAYVDVGSRIGEGDTLCIIEAMKLMNELDSEISGTIAEICIENAQPVEFGQVLFRVDPG